MATKGLLIVISGPSGAGKGTICRALMGLNISDLVLSISATTRKPRSGETEGVSYFFKEKDEFISMIEKDEFIEYAQVFDNFYGTPKKYVADKLNEQKNVILEIDIQGAMKVRHNHKDAVSIFIMPPSFEELKHRIMSRGTESSQDIKKRMSKAFDEVCHAKDYDYIVINDDITKAVNRIQCIIEAEKCKYQRCYIDFNQYREV